MTNNDKTVFIVTPIGGNSSDIRRAAEGVIDSVIIPLLENLGFLASNITVAHRISTTGSINKQIITKIVNDDLVIANLTGLNPNVMYELAIRHAVRKPVIQICEEGTKLPFDIVDERTIFYKNDMLGVKELKDGLYEYVEEALSDERPDNPIYRAIESQIILHQHVSGDLDVNKYILNRLDNIEKSINRNNVPSEKLNNSLVSKDNFIITVKALKSLKSENIIDKISDELYSFIGTGRMQIMHTKRDKLEPGDNMTVEIVANIKDIDKALMILKNYENDLFRVI